MFNINSKIYEDTLNKLISLCDDDDKRIAIKACTEILDRIDEKPKETALKWFIDAES